MPEEPRQLAKDRHPWLRQPRETEEAWAAFVLYRDTKGARDYDETAGQAGIAPHRVRVLAKRWQWQTRVTAYDNHLQHIELKQEEIERREMRGRHATMGRAMAALASKELGKLLKKSEAAPLDSTISVHAISSLAARGTEIERAARGEPTQVHGGVVGVVATGAVPETARDLHTAMLARVQAALRPLTVKVDEPTPADEPAPS